MKQLCTWVCCIALLISTAGSAFGQAFTATISGAITDPNGAAVADAIIRVRNEATGDTRQVNSRADGLYVISQLAPGTYEISAESRASARAFKPGLNSA